jgi:hypothetical protein
VSYEFVWLRGCVENGLLRKVPYLGCVAESGSVALSRAESGLASAIAYYGRLAFQILHQQIRHHLHQNLHFVSLH